ncbi:hypothetical protein M8J77_025655 [Diaphorina citri]|nr:hypothetical protein M8J77_025655 [Diaphorina citri]
MWTVLFICLYVLQVAEISAVKRRKFFDEDNRAANGNNGRQKKPLNKYFYQGGEKLKTKRVRIPVAEFLTSFRMREFEERLGEYIGRSNLYHNLTEELATYHFMSGFLTQLDKEYVITSKQEQACGDHLLIPRLHTKHDDTVIVFQYSGHRDYDTLEQQVRSKLEDMLQQNYKHEILLHFPGGKKESKRIKHVFLVSLGISGDRVIERHKKYKLETQVDKLYHLLHTHLTSHDMLSLQRTLDDYILYSKTRIHTTADLKTLVERFLDRHEGFYPKSNAEESIYIPMTGKRRHGQNIAYLFRYKVMEKGEPTDDVEDNCYLDDTTYFQQFPTVDTVRVVVLVHKKDKSIEVAST